MSVDLSKITNSSGVAKSKDSIVGIGATATRTTAPANPDKGIDPNDKHLCTDYLLTNLKGRTISGAFITIAAQGAQFVLSLASIMVLARLLTPKDFGLFAMVTTVMGNLRAFKDAGLSTVTVQREGITHAQVSNLFWINVTLSGAISLILAAGFPIIAWFYREPRLVPIILILSSTFLLSGLTLPIRRKRLMRAGIDFHLAFSPERENPGNQQITFSEVRAAAATISTHLSCIVAIASSK